MKNKIKKSLLILSAAIVITSCTTVGSGGNDADDLNNTTGMDSGSTLDTGTPAIINGMNGVYSGGDSYRGGKSSGYNSATNGDFYNSPEYGKNVVGGPTANAKDRVIYFSYDSSGIDSRAEAIVLAHAKYLKANPTTRILLEGHTDSRGSREYNISLGERRAISLLKKFNNLGVPAKQIRIVSYGEENPAVTGFSEEFYKRNRRGVIQY